MMCWLLCSARSAPSSASRLRSRFSPDTVSGRQRPSDRLPRASGGRAGALLYWLDRRSVGGARVTLVVFLVMMAGTVGVLYFLSVKDQPGAFVGFSRASSFCSRFRRGERSTFQNDTHDHAQGSCALRASSSRRSPAQADRKRKARRSPGSPPRSRPMATYSFPTARDVPIAATGSAAASTTMPSSRSTSLAC